MNNNEHIKKRLRESAEKLASLYKTDDELRAFKGIVAEPFIDYSNHSQNMDSFDKMCEEIEERMGDRFSNTHFTARDIDANCF